MGINICREGAAMGSTQLNNEMNLQYPDGFKIMSEEELRKHKFYEEAPGFCINDPDRHIVLSVSWRQATLLWRCSPAQRK